ncbi:peptidoglycan-binding protein [Geomicrobium sp. JCM 19038]|uniref:peptidoglycan-binding domain-containing protein n=1 Tax=Geomicrobium sp. JCM 19038 TaxID=1460635 RepID=UPI00045F19B9|nr:peptidoglycan-binding domain-containing protein [Geomicrobium sp. JCM 19038]GAK09152.1 hypothetical protein JCM19038_2973 [Geomicrobium sp. JCM 19038]
MKKLLILLPMFALVAMPLGVQSVEASPDHEQETEQSKGSDALITPGYSPIFEWTPEEQPILQKGPGTSFEKEFLQVMLTHFGFETDIDGIFGAHTEQQVKNLQADQGIAQSGIVDVDTWVVLQEEYGEKIFTEEKAITFAEEALDNDDLRFGIVGYKDVISENRSYYKVQAKSQELIDHGGSGTVGYYDVYNNGEVVESEPPK